MNKFTALCCTALLLVGSCCYAQSIKSFSDDPNVFKDEIRKFLATSDKKKTEQIFLDFEPLWVGGLNVSEQKKVIEVCNAMLKKRFTAFPFFEDYLVAIVHFKRKNISSSSVEAWNEAILSLIDRRSRKAKEIIGFGQQLAKHDVLYQSSSTRWQISPPSYIMSFDSMLVLELNDINLGCYAKGDSTYIESTGGKYFPANLQFIGEGGKFYWTRAGLTRSKVYAEVQQYSINLKSSIFELDKVLFYYKDFFSEPLVGKVEEKILAGVDEEGTSYPRFISDEQNLTIPGLVKDVHYEGGFSLHGQKIVGSGTDEHKAKLIFFRNDTAFLEAYSKSFAIRPDRISAQDAAVTIRWKRDSIYHPGLAFKYIDDKRELTLNRDLVAGNKSPYFNSFHNVDMYFEELKWQIGDPIIDMRMTTAEGNTRLIFESKDYYRDNRFMSMQGIASKHPLAVIKQYDEAFGGSGEIDVRALSDFMKLNEVQTRRLVMGLSNQGFLTYFEESDRAIINDKLFFYLNARKGDVDYDVIQYQSTISGLPNASVNLLNFDIQMRGVPYIVLSDSQRVFIYPDNQEVLLKKDRSFEFNGRVKAGRLDFVGSEFHFDYDQFKIHLKKVDSLRVRVLSDTPNEYGEYPELNLKSVLQNVSGTLFIDSLTNRSGRKRYSRYPIFKSDVESYIYYDHPSVQNGVYDRDRFYFKIDPFTIDSIDNFTRSGMRFDGTFASGGIFDDMRQTLTIQPDLSFGFSIKTPEEGLALNDGKARFSNNLSLSHGGLIGDGRIDYLTSETTSDRIYFYLDSTRAEAQHFVIRNESLNGVAFPEVDAKDVLIDWRHKQDEMFVYNDKVNFSLYEKEAELEGNLVLTPAGLWAKGKMYFAGANLLSEKIDLMQTNFKADTSDFSLNSDDMSTLALSTKNMRSFIDLNTRTGSFSSNGAGSYVQFPVNQYICFIEKFQWNMDQKEIQFGDENQFDIKGSEFVSVHPDQDSLKFNAPLAKYNLEDYRIDASGVKKILVADAEIIPGDGIVTIEKNADMRRFENSAIVANTSSRYHNIINASIKVQGRRSYSGTGKYDYEDQAGINHLINLTNIAVDTAFQTFAIGEITESSIFSLSPKIQYKGSAMIYAANENLFFNGFAKLNHACDKIPVNWFSFEAELDPQGVRIPVKDPENEAGNKLYSGVIFSADSTNIYTAFLSPIFSDKDDIVVNAEGILKYDKNSNEFIIEQETEENSDGMPTISTGYVKMNDITCEIIAEGNIDLGVDLGQLQTSFYGMARNNPVDKSSSFRVFADLNFPFQDKALDAMAELILTYGALPVTETSSSIYRGGLRQVAGADKFEQVDSEISLYGSLKKIPKELKHGIILTDLDMDWIKESSSYMSKGKIGVAFINGNYIGRKLDGYLQVTRRRSGDIFDLYLKLDGFTWYYFNYRRGILQAVSSDDLFNNEINDTKPGARDIDGKDGLPRFQYMLSTDRKMKEFLRSWEENKLGD